MPCNWGVQPAIACAANVSASPAVGFTTTFRFGFAVVVVTGGGRSNYYSSNTMAK
jgi:hypothetical protein